MIKVLFLCTGNSCRSQMAEGWANHLKIDSLEAYSAGIATHGMNPNAIAVMLEAGVDITSQSSKHADELAHIQFDYVVTVCDNAAETCPVFLGNATVVHKPFDDPPRLALQAENEAVAISHYRRVRDEIRDFIKTLPEALSNEALDREAMDRVDHAN